MEPPADPETERRFEAILELLAGRAIAAEVADRLSVSEQRVWQLRRDFLAGGRASLAPRPAGRPPNAPPTTEAIEIEKLRAQLAEARLEAEASAIRETIAIAMPELVARAGPGKGGKKRGSGKGGGGAHGCTE